MKNIFQRSYFFNIPLYGNGICCLSSNTDMHCRIFCTLADFCPQTHVCFLWSDKTLALLEEHQFIVNDYKITFYNLQHQAMTFSCFYVLKYGLNYVQLFGEYTNHKIWSISPNQKCNVWHSLPVSDSLFQFWLLPKFIKNSIFWSKF